MNCEEELRFLRSRHDEAMLVMMAMEVSIDTLREERDEARRAVCELLYNRQGGWPKEHATERGWDCFKENTND